SEGAAETGRAGNHAPDGSNSVIGGTLAHASGYGFSPAPADLGESTCRFSPDQLLLVLPGRLPPHEIPPETDKSEHKQQDDPAAQRTGGKMHPAAFLIDPEEQRPER
ncbi:MAG: hypothetical protein K1X57_23155, partial [Gemmataceae bacterium]|nr:hypothetical protein [Gemmataceae bacterium]